MIKKLPVPFIVLQDAFIKMALNESPWKPTHVVNQIINITYPSNEYYKLAFFCDIML